MWYFTLKTSLAQLHMVVAASCYWAAFIQRLVRVDWKIDGAKYKAVLENNLL